ncbi:hypothetical protein SODALDRAFT_332853 [Sodiomyces alkalinus F11]|uniref:Uncharacterized protein n=1 Tax=Sodiomyces alkalinus (strain CBS 110278 / VKM F-3762 / F11) TaxID=1314773 RepID=A0A3N2PY06_SODAK|nr:hypothetical protein SODALDRAFT_332853 [Sodiomyces alkalinus F11]ROT39410.1 hypothetical protein SODALDRAFT_332853 [Sodiomyces alkalinus F11]
MPWAERGDLGNSFSRIARMYPRSPRLVLPPTIRCRTPRTSSWAPSCGSVRPGNSSANLCLRPFSVLGHLHSSRGHGDSPANLRTRVNRSRNDSGHGNGNGPWREAAPIADERRPAKGSIFNELFPDADLDSPPKEGAALAGPAKESRETPAFRASPAREVLDKEDLVSWLEAQRAQAGLDDSSLPPRDYMPAMLVLWNASKSLAESDFYRVGRQGEHVHGWNGSIRKVVQLFDVNTLEPLDSYFIFFTSRAAARAYKLQAHALFGPLRHATSQQLSSPLFYGPFPTGSDSDPDQQTFTLAPPSPAPLSLKLYALPGSTEARIQPFTIEHILAASASIPSLGSTGKGSTNTATSASSSNHQHVIVSLEGGAVDVPTLLGLVRQDGQERNLAWDMTDVKPYFARKYSEPRPDSKRKQKKAVKNKSNGKAPEIEATNGETRGQLGLSSEASDGALEGGDGAYGIDKGTRGTDAGGDCGFNGNMKTEGPVKSARFVVSFRDALEARRFVRTWHRREFSLSSPTSLESTPNQQQIQGITVNAIIPW